MSLLLAVSGMAVGCKGPFDVVCGWCGELLIIRTDWIRSAAVYDDGTIVVTVERSPLVHSCKAGLRTTPYLVLHDSDVAQQMRADVFNITREEQT